MANKYCTTTSLDIIMIGTNFDTATTALGGKAIEWAESEINKYLSKRYDISGFTVGSIPPVIVSWCEQLAVGSTYRENGRGSKEARERFIAYVEPVQENLQMVRDYQMDLVDSLGSVIADFSNTAYRALSTTDTYTETFAEDNELQWAVDKNKLKDIDGDRD